MPRDYANRRTAYRKSEKVSSAKLWLITVLLIGLFVAGLSYLRTRTQSPIKPIPKLVSKAKSHNEKKVRFDFYTMLPENKAASTVPQTVKMKMPKVSHRPVEVAEQMTLRGEVQSVRSKDSPTLPPPTPTPSVSLKTTPYILQFAAFRRFEQADQLKAQLGLLGIEAIITEVKTQKGAWQRVWVGPYADLAAVTKAQKELQVNHIKSVVIQQK